MPNNKEHLLREFVYNTLDLWDDKAINLFIDGQNSVKCQTLLSHTIVKYNVMFCELWKHIFGTIPTKGDFRELMMLLGGIDQFVSNQHNDVSVQKLINVLPQHTAFLVLQFIPDIKNKITDIFNRLKDMHLTQDITEKILVEKWVHRFYGESVPLKSTTNILQKFVKLYLAYCQKIDCTTLPSSHILRFEPDLEYTTDIDKMTIAERLQYTFYRNNRFMLHMQSCFFIITCKDNVPKYIVESIENTLNIKVCIIYVDCVPKEEHKHDVDCYELSADEFLLLPKIFQHVCCINTPTFIEQSIASNSKTSILIMIDSAIQPLVANRFKFVLSNNVDDCDPLQHVFFLPSTDDEQFNTHVMSQYLKQQSPFKPLGEASVEHNAILYNHFFAIYVSQNNISPPSITSTTSIKRTHNAIVAVDSRFNIATYYAVVMTYHNLLKNGFAWDMVIVTKEENVAKYVTYNERLHLNVKCISFATLNKTRKFSIETYNAVLKHQHFWRTLQSYGYKKCLIVQDDGFMVNGTNFHKYLEYDYVGAPWEDTIGNHYIKRNISKELVGNGGFSLRDIDVMCSICEKYQNEKNALFFNNINEIPEDVYFVKCLVLDKMNIASREVAQTFSIEQVIPHKSFQRINEVVGFHKFYMYHPPSTVWNVFKSFLTNQKSC
jgi:hypothetical protein